MKDKKDQRGMTLLELLPGLALAGLLAALLVTSIYQINKFSSRQSRELAAIGNIQNASHWISADARMAKSTDLAEGSPPASSVTLDWTDLYDGASLPHTSTYSLSGDSLLRTYDGNAMPVGRHIQSVGFTVSGRFLTVSIVSSPHPDVVRQEEYVFLLRPTAQEQ